MNVMRSRWIFVGLDQEKEMYYYDDGMEQDLSTIRERVNECKIR